MPTRVTLPSDDLYARLGVPRDASPEAIELAWRALLRRHHPDVAGPEALELAKRINVAHDWLSDPDLRRRYDRERSSGVRAGRPPRAGADWAPPVRRPVRRPPTTAELVASVVERVGRLTSDELDRLALAEPAPIAFLATLRQVVPQELERQLDEAERGALANLPPAARRSTPIMDAVVGRLADILLGDTLDDILGDPASIWARERLTRGWDSAVGQPRYGPASAAVTALLERLRGLTADDLRQLAGVRHARAARGPAVARRDVARGRRRPARLERARGQRRHRRRRCRARQDEDDGRPTGHVCPTRCHEDRPPARPAARIPDAARSSDTRPHGSAV